jgi:hypothetical protein
VTSVESSPRKLTTLTAETRASKASCAARLPDLPAHVPAAEQVGAPWVRGPALSVGEPAFDWCSQEQEVRVSPCCFEHSRGDGHKIVAIHGLAATGRSEAPKPFLWAKTADQIPASVAASAQGRSSRRLLDRFTDSGRLGGWCETPACQNRRSRRVEGLSQVSHKPPSKSRGRAPERRCGSGALDASWRGRARCTGHSARAGRAPPPRLRGSDPRRSCPAAP